MPHRAAHQRAIVERAVAKKCFSAFADCGLGKTLILLEFARHAHEERGGRVLIVSPLMVVQQTMDQAEEFYKGAYAIKRLAARILADGVRQRSRSWGARLYLLGVIAFLIFAFVSNSPDA